jgi:mono/diheme cytochrome c family protein
VIARQAPAKGDPEAAKIKNPVGATPESIAAGQKTYQTLCAGCHGKDAKGGITISVIEDRGGNQPPDLTDDTWDHGSSDGEIFTVVKKGIAPEFFMVPWEGRISDEEIWNMVNYVKSLSQRK